MSWKVRISKQAREDLDHLRAYSPELYREAFEMTRAVEADPYHGAGAPASAPLLGENVWFRRLSLEHRLVYEIFNSDIIIASYRTHFD